MDNTNFIQGYFGTIMPDTTIPGCICLKVPSENPRTPGDGFGGQRTYLMWNCLVHGWQCEIQPIRGPILDAWDEAEVQMYGWTEGET